LGGDGSEKPTGETMMKRGENVVANAILQENFGR
jgi:hypothetical protein